MKNYLEEVRIILKKFLYIILFLLFTNLSYAQDYKKAYFAGGCFWCMEESFDKVEGVISVVSGYSGGHIKNPTYADVVYTDSGHVEAVEVTYNPKIITYKKLLDAYWQNIDPFDSQGQFCDKGKSYRSVIFFQNKKQKDFFKEMLDDDNFKPNPKKSDKSFFEKVRDMFA